ncbi:MAG: restriction endonuclease subunit S, partial [Gammaproteobacteria bacterium]
MPREGVSAKFLYYFLSYKYEHIRKLGHGANQKNLSAEILKGLSVAYPSNNEAQDTISHSDEAEAATRPLPYSATPVDD